MNKYIRWYDKDKYLSLFMELVQKLPREVQLEIAADMILNIPMVLGKDYDRYINNLSQNKPVAYKRWYDFDPALHSAIEAMHDMSERERIELIMDVADIIARHTNFDVEGYFKQIAQKREDELD